MEQLLPVLFILVAGLIDLIQRWQRRAKRPPLERESEPELIRAPEQAPPPPLRRVPRAVPAPEGPRGPRLVATPVVRSVHPLLQSLQRPADVRQAIVVSTILGRCPGLE